MSALLDSLCGRDRLDVIATNEAAMDIAAVCEWPPVRVETATEYALRRAREAYLRALELQLNGSGRRPS